MFNSIPNSFFRFYADKSRINKTPVHLIIMTLNSRVYSIAHIFAQYSYPIAIFKADNLQYLHFPPTKYAFCFNAHNRTQRIVLIL